MAAVAPHTVSPSSLEVADGVLQGGQPPALLVVHVGVEQLGQAHVQDGLTSSGLATSSGRPGSWAHEGQ